MIFQGANFLVWNSWKKEKKPHCYIDRFITGKMQFSFLWLLSIVFVHVNGILSLLYDSVHTYQRWWFSSQQKGWGLFPCLIQIIFLEYKSHSFVILQGSRVSLGKKEKKERNHIPGGLQTMFQREYYWNIFMILQSYLNIITKIRSVNRKKNRTVSFYLFS